MFCTNCGAGVNPGQEVCLSCGFRVNQSLNYCGNCGAPTPIGATVCLNCGMNIRRSVSNLNGQDKVVMILICFFLGGLGIHNFMMGENKRGIFRLCLFIFCGISYIFALIDLIKLATDTYVYDPNALI